MSLAICSPVCRKVQFYISSLFNFVDVSLGNTIVFFNTEKCENIWKSGEMNQIRPKGIHDFGKLIFAVIFHAALGLQNSMSFYHAT